MKVEERGSRRARPETFHALPLAPARVGSDRAAPAGAPVSGAYKGDISRGERISRVSSEWFSPPDDERYLSLGALHEAVRARAERATARIVETKALRLEATRGIDGDGADLVISRDYISRGLRGRAEELVALELGPRSEQAIRTSLEREAAAECWTSLDRAVRAIADENAGVADLRLAGGDDPELRRVMVGRAQTLEHLGLAEPIGPAQWTLKLDAEPTLRVLGERGDIIKTMHRALSRSDRAPRPWGVRDPRRRPAEWAGSARRSRAA